MQFKWLKNIEPRAFGVPALTIPKVNGKTTPRTMPLPPVLATMLTDWLYKDPLRGAFESQWPFVGQQAQADYFLFPKNVNMDAPREWDKPVTRHGILYRLKRATNIIHDERLQCRATNQAHPFDDFNLDQLGTHSFKRTAVTMLKDLSVSSAVIGTIAGTSPATLERCYDEPTFKRQRRWLSTAFDGVFGDAASSSAAATARPSCGDTGSPSAAATTRPPPDKPPTTVSNEALKSSSLRSQPAYSCYCWKCGRQRCDSQWCFCPQCGEAFM